VFGKRKTQRWRQCLITLGHCFTFSWLASCAQYITLPWKLFLLWKEILMRFAPGWSVYTISMPHYLLIGNIKMDIHVSTLYPWTMDVHLNIFKWMDFSAWIFYFIFYSMDTPTRGVRGLGVISTLSQTIAYLQLFNTLVLKILTFF